jgi:hypothetical protein
MFENRMLRRIFGPKTREVTGGRRELHNEEILDVCCSPNAVRVMKSTRMRWMWTRLEMHTEVLSENLKGIDNVGDAGIDGRIITKFIFNTRGMWKWTGAGSC